MQFYPRLMCSEDVYMRLKLIGTILGLALLAGYGLGTTLPAPFVKGGAPHSLREMIEPTLEAQVGDFRGFQKTFPAQTAVGQTASSGLMRGIAIFHTIELITVGGPVACTYRLQGTRDGTTWFNISAADITCTTTSITFESAAKPAVQVRGNLLTLSGGTTPSVTLKYIGR